MAIDRAEQTWPEEQTIEIESDFAETLARVEEYIAIALVIETRERNYREGR